MSDTIAQKPLVAVGITTRNRATFLPKAIASALAQTYPNLEILVLDDGSSDDTPALMTRFPMAIWRRHDQPRGIIESRNELMRETKAAYYVSLDDDAWFLQNDEISLAVAYAEQNPNVAAVAFDILSPDRHATADRTSPQPAAVFIGCGHMLNLSAVRKAGFYASAPGSYGAEEKDLSLRFADLGLRIVFMPGVHVWHDKAWNDRDWYPLHRSGVCNELYMTVRRCPLPDIAVVLPYKVASFFRYWIRKPRYARAGLAGLFSFFCNLPQAIIYRAPVRRRIFWQMMRRR